MMHIAYKSTIEEAIRAQERAPYPGKILSMGRAPEGSTNRGTWERDRDAIIKKLRTLMEDKNGVSK